MNAKSFIFFALLVTLLCTCSVTSTRWQTFTSKVGNFSVSGPGTMRESAYITDTPAGQIESHVFALERNGYGYTIY